MLSHSATRLMVLLPFICLVSEGVKILIMSIPMRSHITPLLSVATELQKLGHHSTFLMSPRLLSSNIYDTNAFGTIVANTTESLDFHTEMGLMSADYGLKQKWGSTFVIFRVIKAFCDKILGDHSLMKSLLEAKFDFLIIENFPILKSCLAVIGRNFSVPFAFIGSAYEPSILRIPFSPSFVPHMFFNQYTDRMSFKERLFNTLVQLAIFALPSPIDPNVYTPGLPPITDHDILQQAEVTLIDNGPPLDYPKPSMPNVIFIGGLSSSPPKQLEGKLKMFMDSASNGVIIVCFGSIVIELPDDIMNKFWKAFEMTNMNIVWRNKDPESLSRNSRIMTLPWIPQNDLLGHPKTKLFITHCGNSGQYESLYNGVPMIGFPIFAEQTYNARRVAERGLGIMMDIRTFSPEELAANIEKMTNEPSAYRERMQKASSIFRSQTQTPQELGASWIDHVIKYGGDHLRSTGQTMPFYQYLLLDVLVIVSVGISLCLWITIRILRACFSLLKNKQKQE